MANDFFIIMDGKLQYVKTLYPIGGAGLVCMCENRKIFIDQKTLDNSIKFWIVRHPRVSLNFWFLIILNVILILLLTIAYLKFVD